jgi:hypothetical protein
MSSVTSSMGLTCGIYDFWRRPRQLLTRTSIYRSLDNIFKSPQGHDPAAFSIFDIPWTAYITYTVAPGNMSSQLKKLIWRLCSPRTCCCLGNFANFSLSHTAFPSFHWGERHHITRPVPNELLMQRMRHIVSTGRVQYERGDYDEEAIRDTLQAYTGL